MANTFQLPNGITIVHEERPGTKTVSMSITVRHGAMDDAYDEHGLTNLTVELLAGGTTTRNRDEIAETIEAKGGSYYVEATKTISNIVANSLARNFEDTFSVMTDMLINPSFETDEILKTKIQTCQYIDSLAQNPSRVAQKQFIEAAMTGNGGRSVEGEKALVMGYSPQQIKDKHTEILAHPENMVVSIVGDTDFESAKKLVVKELQGLQRSAIAKTNPTTSFAGQDMREDTQNEQLNVFFGFPAPSHEDPEHYSYAMLSQIIGGGMSSPLFQEVREKRSLVYGVASIFTSFAEQGLFYINASCSPEKAQELISVSIDVIGNVLKTGVTQDQLDIAREKIMRSYKTSQESSNRVRAGLTSEILRYGRAISIEEVDEHLKAITPDDITHAVFNMLEKGDYALSAVGPLVKMPDEKEIKSFISNQLTGISPPKIPAKKMGFTLGTTFAAAKKKEHTQSKPPQITTLSNGLKVVTIERSGSLACGAWVGAGSDHETPALSGATHMNEHMMFLGTTSYRAGEIDIIVEQELRGGLNAYTNNDQTAYYFFNLEGSAVETIVDICGEMVFEALIPEDKYGDRITDPETGEPSSTGERGVVLEEIKMMDDKPFTHVHYQVDRLAYDGHAHSRPIIGTRESLLDISAQMLRDYRDGFYAPNNVTFVAVGPIKHEDFVDIVQSKQGHRKPMAFPSLTKPEYKGGTDYIEVDANNLSQSIIALCAEGVSSLDEYLYIYRALETILGDGQSSILTKRLVHDENIALGVSVANHDYRNCGTFCTYTQLDAKNIKQAVRSIYEEYNNLLNNLSEKDLDKAKAHMEMEALSEMESNEDACYTIANYVLANEDVTTPEEISQKIQAVTLDDVKRVMRNILASNPTLSMVVPEGTDPALLPTHAEVLAMRDGQTGPAQTQAPKTPGL